MSIISAFIGTIGGLPPKMATWGGITFDPVNEGQQQTFTVDFANWDSSTVYWELVQAGSGTRLDSRVVGGQAYGTISPGNGNSTQTVNFTFAADATTEGTTYYVIRIGSTSGGNEYINQGNFAVRDSSQTPALVLDLDPANYSSGSPTVWPDTSGLNHTGGIYFVTTSSDNGGVFVWNGTSTASEVTGLNISTYGTITLSAWIKPTAVIGSTQAIIAKELCYKLEITTNGSIAWMTAKGYNPWEITAYADVGLVTAGAWSHVLATVDANYTRIYINGVKVTETTGNIIGANTSPFDIGMWQTTGSPTDYFGGKMGEVKVWNYAITEAAVLGEYNTTAARYGQSTIPLSLSFTGTNYLLVSNTQSDWNLGSTSTIEFWSKTISTSSIRTVASQGPGNGIDVGFHSGHLLYRNTEPTYPEPTPGSWTHVAFVSTGSGITNLYYNGVYQTNFYGGSLNDGSTDLAIGRRGPTNNFQYFNGKLAMIRISNTAKYTSGFNPSNSYGVESDTRLLLGNDPTVDGTGNHPVSIQGAVGVSTDFPTYQSLVFNQPEGDYLVTPASSDWNLGNNWTIEFWMKANNSSASGIHIPGGQWGLIDQGGWYGGRPNNTILIGLAGGYLTIAQDRDTDISFAEPSVGGVPITLYNVSSPGGWNTGVNWSNLATTGGTGTGLRISVVGATGGYANAISIVTPGSGYTSGDVITATGESSVSFTIGSCTARGVWTHVAVVNNGGGSAQKVYYNGVEQTKISGTYQSNGWTNTAGDLYIGRLSNHYGAYASHFDGKMAMVRISNTAKYLNTFTSTTSYGVESDTVLFLDKFNPLVDAKAHPITNNGVTKSNSFPAV